MGSTSQPTTYSPDTIKVGQVWRDDRDHTSWIVTSVGIAGARVKNHPAGEFTTFAWAAFGYLRLIGGAK